VTTGNDGSSVYYDKAPVTMGWRRREQKAQNTFSKKKRKQPYTSKGEKKTLLAIIKMCLQ